MSSFHDKSIKVPSFPKVIHTLEHFVDKIFLCHNLCSNTNQLYLQRFFYGRLPVLGS